MMPEDSRWHAEYANLIYLYLLSNRMTLPFYDPQYTIGRPEIILVASEIKQALELDPNNELALNLVQWINMDYPSAILITKNGYEYPILDSNGGIYAYLWSPTNLPSPSMVQPTPTAIQEITQTPVQTATAQSVAQIDLTPTAKDAPRRSEITATPEAPISSPNPIPKWIDIAVMSGLLLGLGWLIWRNRSK